MNVLLISLDTTRADHLGCYGYPRATSPHLDRFARSCAVFEACFSTHIPTHPAHTAMMTGRDPFETGIISQGGRVPLPDSVPMLAEIVGSRGYFTAAADNLGKWFSRGFDLYRSYSWEMPPGGPWRKGEAVSTAALEVLGRCAAQERPFFCFVHFWDAHTPYLPPPPFDRMFYAGNERDPQNPSMDALWEFEPFRHYFAEWLPSVTDIQFPIAQYDAEIEYMDACLSHLLVRIEEDARFRDTLVVVTADHGEEMDEHECWFDHHGLYDTNVRVPLIVRHPAGLGSSTRPRGLVRTLDITPTILDLIGVEALQGASVQGKSFAPALHDPTGWQGTVEELFLTENTWMKKRAYRNRDFKYIQALEEDIHGKPPEELYDLSSDPGERNNLAAERRGLASAFRKKIEEWTAERERSSGNPDPLQTQAISLRRIGNPETSVPRRAAQRGPTENKS